MSRSHLKAFAAALAGHAALLLFGGLLLFRPEAGGKVVQDVELISDDPAGEARRKEAEAEERKKAEERDAAEEPEPSQEALQEETPQAPELSRLAGLEGPAAHAALESLSLSALEAALNAGAGEGGVFAESFRLTSGGRIGGSGTGSGDESPGMQGIFSLAELDQRPRPVFQAAPHYPQELRRRRVQGTVHVVFLVDTEGKVITPRVEKSTHASFDRPALEAVRQWRFEAGTRNGRKVQFKMRVPITFSAG